MSAIDGHTSACAFLCHCLLPRATLLYLSAVCAARIGLLERQSRVSARVQLIGASCAIIISREALVSFASSRRNSHRVRYKCARLMAFQRCVLNNRSLRLKFHHPLRVYVAFVFGRYRGVSARARRLALHHLHRCSWCIVCAAVRKCLAKCTPSRVCVHVQAHGSGC